MPSSPSLPSRSLTQAGSLALLLLLATPLVGLGQSPAATVIRAADPRGGAAATTSGAPVTVAVAVVVLGLAVAVATILAIRISAMLERRP